MSNLVCTSTHGKTTKHGTLSAGDKPWDDSRLYVPPPDHFRARVFLTIMSQWSGMTTDLAAVSANLVSIQDHLGKCMCELAHMPLAYASSCTQASRKFDITVTMTKLVHESGDASRGSGTSHCCTEVLRRK